MTDQHLAGELTLTPKGKLVLVLRLVSGVALVRASLELLGRLVLGYRRPATLRLNDQGLQVSHRTLLLGRTLREEEMLVPLSNLGSVTREVRFARFGLHAGLFTLGLGTYVGVGLLVDGARVPGGSPSLLAMGAAAIALGVLLDFALSVAWDAVRKTSRVVIVPRQGPALCLHGVDPTDADRVLADLQGALHGLREPPASPHPG